MLWLCTFEQIVYRQRQLIYPDPQLYCILHNVVIRSENIRMEERSATNSLFILFMVKLGDETVNVFRNGRKHFLCYCVVLWKTRAMVHWAVMQDLF